MSFGPEDNTASKITGFLMQNGLTDRDLLIYLKQTGVIQKLTAEQHRHIPEGHEPGEAERVSMASKACNDLARTLMQPAENLARASFHVGEQSVGMFGLKDYVGTFDMFVVKRDAL